MILGRDQIQRYMRHIIMPEVGGPGQKILLNSSILILCGSISDSALLLYYLAAMGIGKISCYVEDTDGIELISENVGGLNPDLELLIADTSSDRTANYDATIIFCEKSVENLKIDITNVPIVFAAVAGDCGYIRTIRTEDNINQTIDEINSFFINNKSYEYLPLFSKAYIGFTCTLAAIEVVKLMLGISGNKGKALQFNLATYDFNYGHIKNESVEYTSNLKAAREKLSKTKVLIIGCGGLGSPTAYMLAMSGIGKIGLIDYDTVEVSNLNRQILHSNNNIGMAKVKSAEQFLNRLNPAVEICTYNQKFSLENAEKLIADYDMVIDGLDNLPARYLLNDVCYFLGKTWIEAGVLRFSGLSTTILPGKSPCYRCIFPESKENSPVCSCSESGVLGAVPGVMGMIQTIEAVKLITGLGVPLVNKILYFDALYDEFTLFGVESSPNCELCGVKPTIPDLRL